MVNPCSSFCDMLPYRSDNMKNFLPNIDVIVDAETIGIFKHNYKKAANIPLIANGIRNENAMGNYLRQ